MYWLREPHNSFSKSRIHFFGLTWSNTENFHFFCSHFTPFFPQYWKRSNVREYEKCGNSREYGKKIFRVLVECNEHIMRCTYCERVHMRAWVCVKITLCWHGNPSPYQNLPQLKIAFLLYTFSTQIDKISRTHDHWCDILENEI